jgi:hypothetical protein
MMMEERAKPNTPCAPLSCGGILATRKNLREKRQSKQKTKRKEDSNGYMIEKPKENEKNSDIKQKNKTKQLVPYCCTQPRALRA